MESKINIIEGMKYKEIKTIQWLSSRKFDFMSVDVKKLRLDKRAYRLKKFIEENKKRKIKLAWGVPTRRYDSKVRFILSRALYFFWKKNFYLKKPSKIKIRRKKRLKRLLKQLKRKKLIFKKNFNRKGTFLRSIRFKQYNRYFRKMTFRWYKQYMRKRRILKIKIRKFERLNSEKTCYVLLKHTFSNFFVVITDLKGKVLGYISAGCVNDSSNIKRKKSYFLVNNMMNALLHKLRKFNISCIRIKIRSNTTYHMRKVVSFLQFNGFKLQNILFLKPIPHHFGQRRRKLRRV